MVPYMGLFPHGNDPTQGLDAGTVDLSGNAAVANFIGLRFNAPVLTFNNVYIARFDYNITKDGRHSIFWRGSMQGLKTDVTEAQFPGQSAASQLLTIAAGTPFSTRASSVPIGLTPPATDLRVWE